MPVRRSLAARGGSAHTTTHIASVRNPTSTPSPSPPPARSQNARTLRAPPPCTAAAAAAAAAAHAHAHVPMLGCPRGGPQSMAGIPFCSSKTRIAASRCIASVYSVLTWRGKGALRAWRAEGVAR